MEANPNRTLAFILGGIAVLVVVAAAVAALRPVPVLDPGSPEGVVQRYLKAVLADDSSEAAALLAPELGCDAADFARGGFNDQVRVALVNTDIDDSGATVEVDISYGGGGPFGSEYVETESFELIRVDGGWLLSGQPWPVYFCGGDG